MLLALLLGSVLSLSAQQVTQEAAFKKAEQFLGKTNISRRAPHKAPQLTLANNRDEFYIFNDEANGGYVIVSGEERMPDVLAYSYDSRFDADNIPCNMKAWLEGYAEQVKYLRTHPEASARRTTTERENVGPLMTCWFAQSSPYNDKCPEVDGKHCVTGCVATAMAQIMYYWKWPEQTTDVIPGYTSYTHNIEMPAIPVTTIDWDNMLGQYKSWESYTKEQTDAISTLMLLCGTSVYMDYTPSQSGAHSITAAQVFPKYFDYDDLLEHIYRSANTEDWEQLIYDEMKSKRPVLYSGFSNGGTGHAFVLDGYQDGFFHVNWGWRGYETYVQMTDTEGWEGYTEEHSAVVGIQPTSADNPSRYAVIDNGTMTLYYDKKKSSRSGTVLVHKDDWVNYREKITECVIDKSFADLKQKSLEGYFHGFKNLKSIKGLMYLDTSETSNMDFMFDGCESLTSLDVSGFKTDKVTRMFRMFAGCSGLTSLDVSGFRTDNVTYMGSMFSGCCSLTKLDVSGFKTDNVTDMGGMFGNCSNLTSLDVSGFKTDNVTSMMSMFWGCSGLTELDVSGFKTDKVISMMSMFWGCSGLTELDVSGFKTDKVISMNSMFRGCSALTKLDVSGFKTDNVTDMRSMFFDLFGLTSLDVSGFKTDNVTDMGWMFGGCSGLKSLDVSGFKTDNVKDMGYMFWGLSGLTILDVSGFKTDNVTNMGGMFLNCSGLTNLDVSKFKTDNVTTMSEMFYNCSGLTSLDVSGFNTANVTIMNHMYAFCSELTTIYASERWSTSNLDRSSEDNIKMMFASCSKIVGGKGTTYNPDHVNDDYAHIDEGPSNPGYFTYKVPNIIMGDVNGDGVVNVTDIVATVNYIMEKPSDDFNKDAADLNGDGEINVTDIVKMVTIIMSGDGGSSRRAAATSGKLVISGHNIQLRNAENYIAAQFDINLSDGQSISDIVLNGSSNHDLHWKMIDASTCRVVVYSMTNAAFRANSDNLFTVFMTGSQNATISNEILIKADGTTGIDAIHTEAENGNVYDLNGRQVKTPRKGVYIINGRKVVVK